MHLRGYPVAADPKPYPKTKQLARGERRYRRKVASPAKWQRIIETKRGDGCRVCIPELAILEPIEYHHLVPRAQGGDDVADNVIPLCRPHHELISRRVGAGLQIVAESLSDAEYAYCVGELGEGAMERLFGVSVVSPAGREQ